MRETLIFRKYLCSNLHFSGKVHFAVSVHTVSEDIDALFKKKDPHCCKQFYRVCCIEVVNQQIEHKSFD